MKRIIAFFTAFLLFLYLCVLMYGTVPGFAKIPFLGRQLKSFQRTAGIGTLFDRPSTLVNYTAYIRYYNNNQWQPWEQMMKPLHDEYLATGKFSSLKHSRFESNILREMGKLARRKGISVLKADKQYTDFKEHILYRHWIGIKPDSLEFMYLRFNRKTLKSEPVLIFKDTL